MSWELACPSAENLLVLVVNGWLEQACITGGDDSSRQGAATQVTRFQQRYKKKSFNVWYAEEKHLPFISL